MSEFVNTADLIGDAVLTDSIIDKTVTEMADDRVLVVGEKAFYKCMQLTSVNFPNAEEVGESGLYYCNALKRADFTKLSKIGASAFAYDSQLVALILRGETVPSLYGSISFNQSKIGIGTGYIYVPAAMVDTYKAETNWSTYADQFRALEDYTVDGTITGELDETKI